MNPPEFETQNTHQNLLFNLDFTHGSGKPFSLIIAKAHQIKSAFYKYKGLFGKIIKAKLENSLVDGLETVDASSHSVLDGDQFKKRNGGDMG